MARQEAADRLRRLLGVLPWLASVGRAPLSEVARRTGMRGDEVVALLELAACCGLPPYTPDQLIELIVHDDSVEANLGPLLSRPMRFNASEGFALAASARAILTVPGTDPGGDLAAALAKLEGALGGRTGLTVELDEPDHLTLARQAVSDGESLDIEYYSASRDAVSDRRVDPVSVAARDGHWYMEAFCHLAGAMRQFRVDRIGAAVATGERFSPLPATSTVAGPPGPEGEQPVGRAPFAPSAGLPRVRLSLPPEALWVVDAYATEEVSPAGEGRTEVVLPVGGHAWLERLLLRLGPPARVIDPPELRGAGRDAARRVLALYGDAAAT